MVLQQNPTACEQLKDDEGMEDACMKCLCQEHMFGLGKGEGSKGLGGKEGKAPSCSTVIMVDLVPLAVLVWVLVAYRERMTRWWVIVSLGLYALIVGEALGRCE